MTQPDTGDVWPNIHGYNTGNLRKALQGSILIRDHDGVNTSLAFTERDGVWQSGFTPFAADKRLRKDLLRELGGTWFDLGGGASDGPLFANSVNVQKDHIWQTRQVVRTDVTSEEGTFQFGMAETNNLAQDLEWDLPMGTSAIVGTPNAAQKKPLEFEGRLRQILAIWVDKGDNVTVDVLPAVSFENIDDRRLSPEELINWVFTWGIEIDPHSGYSHARFHGGRGWEVNPGLPLFGVEAPVATAGAGGAVTIVFDEPRGPATPFTYAVKQTQVDTGVVSDLTVSGSPSVSDGEVTISGSGLTASKEYTFQVYATNTAGGVSISPTSNKVTGLGS